MSTTNSKSEGRIYARIAQSIKDRTLFKVKFAPINVPRNRRLETLAAFCWVMAPFFFGPFCWYLIIYLIAYTATGKYFAIAYLIWMYVDKETCERGGRRWEWFRKLKWWKYYKEYFPVELVVTNKLAPDKNYLFAGYPHGILASGAFSAFGTDAHDLKSKLPGIKPYVCTLKINFDLPIIREIALALGLIAASRESLNWVLGGPGKGRAAILIVGGAAESLYNKPGEYKIILKHRKGFCKVALINGASIVPVFTFGEIDIYDQFVPEKNSWMDALQHWVKEKTGIVPVMFFGRGIFQYTFGFLPKRRHVTVVVGKPIEVKQVEHPTVEEVDELHNKFKEQIVALFNEEKHKYLDDPSTELIID